MKKMVLIRIMFGLVMISGPILAYAQENDTSKVVFRKMETPPLEWREYTLLKSGNSIDSVFVAGKLYMIYQSHQGKKEGISVVYYPSGTTREQVSYRNDCQTGSYISYYENGKIQAMGNYIVSDSSTQYSENPVDSLNRNSMFIKYSAGTASPCNSIKDGLWYYFSANGKLLYSENWLNGQMAEKVNY